MCARLDRLHGGLFLLALAGCAAAATPSADRPSVPQTNEAAVVTIPGPPTTAPAASLEEEDAPRPPTASGEEAEGNGIELTEVDSDDGDGGGVLYGPVGVQRSGTATHPTSPSSSSGPQKAGCWPGERGCPPLGVPECDAMYRKMRACFASMASASATAAPAMEEALLAALDSMRNVIRNAGHDPSTLKMMAQACSQTASSMAAMCPTP